MWQTPPRTRLDELRERMPDLFPDELPDEARSVVDTALGCAVAVALVVPVALVFLRGWSRGSRWVRFGIAFAVGAVMAWVLT